MSDYSTSSYWTRRFQQETQSFEWLGGQDSIFTSLIDHAIGTCGHGNSQVMHVGCGSSTLSLWLRQRVRQPDQIVNVDFAVPAIELGRRWERERWPDESTNMYWRSADLLDFADVASLQRHSGEPIWYDVVVDKSTLDAIQCGEDRVVQGELVHRIKHNRPEIEPSSISEALEPGAAFALNLAAVTRSGARWICMSYSMDRFDFLDKHPSSFSKVSLGHLHDLVRSLWHIDERLEVPVQQDEDKNSAAYVHRPKIFNYCYVVRRTDVLV